MNTIRQPFTPLSSNFPLSPLRRREENKENIDPNERHHVDTPRPVIRRIRRPLTNITNLMQNVITE